MKSAPSTARKRVAASAECRRCHYRFPKPEMHEVKISGSPRHHYRAGGAYGGTSVTERSGWVCDECYLAYKRDNRTTVFGVVWAIIKGMLASIGAPPGRR